jgi:aspartate/methionine/tyrosine aminotransferase
MGRLGTETAFEVLAKAKQLEAQGKDIIHLEIGEPDFDTPQNIVEAGVQALRDGYTHYGPAAGLPEAREVVADYVARTRGISCGADEVVIVPGGKPTMFYAIMALVNPGDEVIYPNPGFPIYESMIQFVGGKAVSCPIREENAFALDPQDVISRITPNTRMVVLNSPANPTGGVTGKAELEQICAELRKHPDIWILSDEIYSRMLYDGAEHFSPLSDPELRDRIILLDGWSKTYAMTGWRLGFGVMRPDLERAGMEALTGDQSAVDAMLAEFDTRRKLIVELANSVPGMSCHLPVGAFYIMPSIKATGRKAKELQDLLLEEAGVASLAGTAFGAEGEGYLRFSYANSVENIERAFDRIRDTFAKLS